ncbi:MAG: hypothetical protein QG592_698, partial [Pseudomonadota bacterium]|nr:hypothetical protein [Pseudomonadota bacterium]
MLLPRRLSAQIALLVSLLFMATVFFYTWYTAAEQSELSERQQTGQIRALSRSLAGAIAEPLVLGDYAAIETLLLQTAEYPS